MLRSINTFRKFVILTILSIATSFNIFADETIRRPKTETSGFEWIEVVYRSNGEAFIGATTKSGDWIIPLGDQLIYYKEQLIRGKYYGFFDVQKEYSGEWKAALYSPTGDELVKCGRYGMFFWSDDKIRGTGPSSYETINIGLSKLTLESNPPVSSPNSHSASGYCEYTRDFFSTPKSYSIEDHTLKLMGPSGVTRYKPGESTFSVTSNGFSYKFKDGSGSSRKITSPLKNVTVLTSRGDVQMQMYILDNGIAVRAIRYNDGHCVVHQYVLNKATSKYINNDWFTLRK